MFGFLWKIKKELNGKQTISYSLFLLFNLYSNFDCLSLYTIVKSRDYTVNKISSKSDLYIILFSFGLAYQCLNGVILYEGNEGTCRMRKLCFYLEGDLPLIEIVNDLALYLLPFSLSYFVQKKTSRMKENFYTGSKFLVFAHIRVKTKLLFYTEIFTQ